MRLPTLVLIGISCVFNQHAGLVLASANVFEMGFVGASFANTITRCAGATQKARLTAIYVAPFMMLLGALIGAVLGNVSQEMPAVVRACDAHAAAMRVQALIHCGRSLLVS